MMAVSLHARASPLLFKYGFQPLTPLGGYTLCIKVDLNYPFLLSATL